MMRTVGCSLVVVAALLSRADGQQSSCDSAQLAATTRIVNDLCCGGTTCTGVPTECDTNCAPTYMWLYSHCYTTLTAQGNAAQYQSLASKCRAAEAAKREGLPCTPRQHDSISTTWAGTHIPDPTDTMDGEGFCFGATSADTVIELFGNTYTGETSGGAGNGLSTHNFEGSGWTVVNDDPITEAGYWATYDAEAYLRQQVGEAGFATSWALYQGSNSWGNYPADAPDPALGDNALMGTYLMYTGPAVNPVFESFIVEADIHTHDNDGIGFIFGFQDVDHHFVAHEVNDAWPSEAKAADGVSGPCMKIRERFAHPPSDQPLTSANNVYTILPSNDGDNGLAVNKAGYTPYPENGWFKIGLKVTQSGRGTYSATMQSTRPDHDAVTAGGWTTEKVTGHTSSYQPGKVGIFSYAEQFTVDNIRLTPLLPNEPVSSYVSFCNGRGSCSGEHSYHESPGDNAYLGGCADNCAQFNTLAECENHCTTLGHSCGGCTLEFQNQETGQGGAVDDGNWNHCVTSETIREIDPSLLPGEGWVRLRQDRIAGESQCSMFKYRYQHGDSWYESPPTDQKFDFGSFFELQGTWSSGTGQPNTPDGNTATGSFQCTGGEAGCYGIGCSNGGGSTDKVLIWCQDSGSWDGCGGCGHRPPVGTDNGDNGGTDTVCTGTAAGQTGWGREADDARSSTDCVDANIYYQCADATPVAGCWKFETRASNTFGRSPYREKSWKKQDYTCDCGCAPTIEVSGAERPQDTFVDCSRSYVGLIRGCADPSANNYQSDTEMHDHSCSYDFEHGALDFGYGGTSSGHVAVPLGIDDLPTEAITIEAWVRMNMMGPEWSGMISAAQDDSANEFGFTILQRSNDAGEFRWSFGLSTAGGSDADGDGDMTYLQDDRSTHPVNEWHHVASIYDGTTMQMLIDGVVTATDATSQSGAIRYPHSTYLNRVNQIHGGWFTIGAYNDANEYYPMDGLLDELRLWNIARSAADIGGTNCNDPCAYGGSTGCVAGLMHFWRFDENHGAAVADMVEGGVAGQLIGEVRREEHALCESTGCTDQSATNYDANAGSYDHSCSYDTTGALDFTHGRTSAHAGANNAVGHVAHVGVPDVHVGDHMLPETDMTVECWVKFIEPFVEWAGCVSFAQDDGSTEYGVFLSARAATATSAQLSFALSSTGAMQQSGSTTGHMTYAYGTETAVQAGEWIHWAGVYNGGVGTGGSRNGGDSMSVYLNGALALTNGDQFGAINYPPAGYASAAGGWFTLGAYHDANEYYPLNGMQDDTRLWNVARSAQQIQSSYCSVLGHKNHGLLAYWKFEETDGATCTNEVRNAPDGIMMGDVFRTVHNIDDDCGGGH